MSCNGLANLLRDMGKYAEAEPFYSRAHELNHKILGPEHQYTIVSQASLGYNIVKGNRDRYAEGTRLLENAIERLRALDGPKERISTLHGYLTEAKTLHR